MNIELSDRYKDQGLTFVEIDILDGLFRHPDLTPSGRAAAEKNIGLVVAILNKVGLEKSLSAHPKNLAIEIHFGEPKGGIFL